MIKRLNEFLTIRFRKLLQCWPNTNTDIFKGNHVWLAVIAEHKFMIDDLDVLYLIQGIADLFL